VSVSKVATMSQAVGALVSDGDTVAIEGFTHLICHAAGHELIRQQRRDLTLCRLTPDIVADQLVAAGVVSRLVFSWLGNPGVGSLHAIRRRIETADPAPIEIEEYSHFGMVARYAAGAAGLPFFPLRSYTHSDLPIANPRILPVESPYGDDPVFAVPPLNPDLAIIHVQRATAEGDAQVWGLLGCQKEAAFAARQVMVVCEEVVPESVVRSDPNRTLIPGTIVDAVVEAPGGCHPSFAQGYYDRDNRFYVEWDAISRHPDRLQAWLQEWVYGMADHAEYRARLGAERWADLAPGEAWSAPVNYGSPQ
jgi:glutaconate CoA-transferase subunit A